MAESILIVIIAVWVTTCISISLSSIVKARRNNDDKVHGGALEEEVVECEKEDEEDVSEAPARRFPWKIVLGVAVAVTLLVAGFVSMIYMPKKACEELDVLYCNACEKGIDLVTDSDLERVENYRKMSIVFGKDKQSEYDYKYGVLKKAVQKWNQISSDESFEEKAHRIKLMRWAEGQLKKLDGKTMIKSTKEKTTFRPYTVDDDVFIVKIGFDGLNVQPDDFPVYEEYQRYMDVFGPSADIV